MATIGVLTYTLPDGLKLNKNFINKTLNQNSTIINTTTEKRINYNKFNNNNKPNKIINLTNIESLGMIGTDVIVMRTKQKLTPLKEPQNHNIENQQLTIDSIKQPPAKKQKLMTSITPTTTATINNVTVTTMPLSDIINTSNVTTTTTTTTTTPKLPINNVTNSISSTTSTNPIITNPITVPLNSSNFIIKQDSVINSSNTTTQLTTNHQKKTSTIVEKSVGDGITKICGTNTKTNQPITTGGRKSTPLPQAVARRNARERNRVKQVNNGFAALRQRIPDEVAEAFEVTGGRGTNKKLSKVETLRMAVEYIRSLERILGFEYPTNMMTSSIAGSDGMLSPLPSDDDNFLFNSTSDYITNNMSETSPPQSLTPPPIPQQQQQQQQQQQHLNIIKNENSVIKIENSSTPSPLDHPGNSPEDQLGSSFDDGNSNLYENDEGTIYYTDNLPDITTINGQDYLRIPGTNTYQLITPEMLENEENIHPTNISIFNSKSILNGKNNFVDLNELIIHASNIQQQNEPPQQQQLPLPSMPFTTSMLDQQRTIQISQYSLSTGNQQHQQHHNQHHSNQQSISPLTINCISENTPALIPSPDQFSSQSSNMSGSSYTTRTTTNTTNIGHNNNNNFTTIIDQQHLMGQQLQNQNNLLAELQHLHNQEQERHQHQQSQQQLLKVKTEPQQQQQQHQKQQTQIMHEQLPTNSSQLNRHEFDHNHDFSKTIATNGNNSHIYETINSVINQNRCDQTVLRNRHDELKIQKVKIERNVILNTGDLTEENMFDAIEWWEANTPKSDEC